MESKCQGRLKALRKFQTLHPDQFKCFKSIAESSQVLSKQNSLFERETEEMNCEYKNMKANQERSKYKIEDILSDQARKKHGITKVVNFSDNFNNRAVNPKVDNTKYKFRIGDKDDK